MLLNSLSQVESKHWSLHFLKKRNDDYMNFMKNVCSKELFFKKNEHWINITKIIEYIYVSKYTSDKNNKLKLDIWKWTVTMISYKLIEVVFAKISSFITKKMEQRVHLPYFEIYILLISFPTSYKIFSIIAIIWKS